MQPMPPSCASGQTFAPLTAPEGSRAARATQLAARLSSLRAVALAYGVRSHIVVYLGFVTDIAAGRLASTDKELDGMLLRAQTYCDMAEAQVSSLQ
jgi:hypothetical protein